MIIFDSDFHAPRHAQEHCVILPVRLESKTSLFAFLQDALSLPDYFGHNWDALEECLNDPGALQHHKVVLVHHDLPLESEPEEQRTYLHILGAAARESRTLDAVFPEAFRARLAQILAA